MGIYQGSSRQGSASDGSDDGSPSLYQYGMASAHARLWTFEGIMIIARKEDMDFGMLCDHEMRVGVQAYAS